MRPHAAKRPPTTDDYINAFLTIMRAPQRTRTQYGPAGRATIRTTNEHVIYGPGGYPFRIIEDPTGGTHVEEYDGEHLHAVARPPTMTLNRPPRFLRSKGGRT